MELTSLLEAMITRGAGDLHLQSGDPPVLRVGGRLERLDMEAITDGWLRELMPQISSEDAQVALDERRSIDFSFALPERARFRVNAYFEQGRMCMALRLVPIEIPPFDELNLPHAIQEITQAPRGLIVVAGTTGSGKSTTLAAMINRINETRADRIITIEDPIEFAHRSKKALIAQREIGRDATTFHESLRMALRQDPDVILIGELRDQETMRTSLQAADTGHAVYTTVHTTNAAQTVQRLIALFPPDERELILMQLSMNLEAVICQRLARTIDGKNRIPIVEILRNTPVVRKLIRKNELGSLSQAIANQDQGMQLFDQHLGKLWKAEIISGTEALRLATSPESLTMIMKGLSTKDLAASLVVS